MPRSRRKDEHLIQVALKADWKFSAVIAAAVLIVGLVVAPAVARGNVLLTALLPASRPIAWVFASIFGVIALFRFIAQRGDPTSEPNTSIRFARRSKETIRTNVVMPDGILNEFSVSPRHEPDVASKPTAWSLELLQSLDWKRFEEVVAAYFRAKTFRSEMLAYGPDGGVDVRLFFGDSNTPVGLVQCKAWGKRRVGVAEVRELLGVMAHEKILRGYFAATGDFTVDAIAFAKANPIVLISGTDLLLAIAKMDREQSAQLLTKATAGDYTTPSCASCGDKLYRKTFKTGRAAWVCKRYPGCRTKIWVAPAF